MIGATLRLWMCKWSLLRFALACFVCWVLAADTGARLARLQLAALPDFNYLSEIEALRVQGRYGEAEVIANAGLTSLPPGQQREQVQTALKTVLAERDSWVRRVTKVGIGAISGRGTDLESLIGAVAADFFVVGDIRDLVIEGGKLLVDGDSDELVLLLSFVGVVTTLAPEIDWAPSILKAARRAGHVTVGMADYLKSAIKGKRGSEIAHVCEDVARISKKASPGGAMRALRFAEKPEDLTRIAHFVESAPNAAFALHVTGKEGVAAIKAAGAAEPAIKAAESLVVAAARKGPAGARFLSSAAANSLLKPHAVIGIIKALWKGNAEGLITRGLDRIDPMAWWGMPAAAAWAFFEAMLLWKKLVTHVERTKASKTRAA